MLSHAQFGGYWEQLGRSFEAALAALLDSHILSGLLDAPWMHPGGIDVTDDELFADAYNELADYAFQEVSRLVWARNTFTGKDAQEALKMPSILREMRSMLETYRAQLINESRRLDMRGGVQ